ncbi:HAD family hydrolase [Nisaea sediminum]|uniref:HAD family hydrolase n=1 Tax=Nisaea sediminum TaxID=2775867 RepID=UPI001866FD1A|nr:HAD family hydrolase [Nisaea sediminum]
MECDLVIFDCDGVLVDSEAIANRCTAEAMTQAGVPILPEEALKRFLGGKLTFIQKDVEAMIGRELGDDWVPKIYAKQFALYRKELRAIPGIDRALTRISDAGKKICVGSNGPVEKMEVTLGVTNLKRHFRGAIFSADMVGIPKPQPDLYLYCAERMGVAPERCVVVEDSPTGARAGIAAGMRVFGYSAAHGPDGLAEVGVHALFDDMADLPGMLGIDAPELPEERFG